MTNRDAEQFADAMAEFPRAEVLISRIVDGEATEAERAEFRALAAESPELLDALAEAERTHGLLADALAGELAGVAAVGVQVARGGSGDAASPPGRRAFDSASEDAKAGMRRRIGLFGAWGGWAVAAAVLLGVFLPLGEAGPGAGGEAGGSAHVQTSQQAGLLSIDETLRMYMQRGVETGRVLDPEPRLVLLDARPEAGGLVEVRYMRQIFERAVVEDVYELAPDDGGVLVPVRLDVRPRRSVAM